MYKNTKKEDLIYVAKELGTVVQETVTMLKLKDLIESTDVFKKDTDFVKDLILTTVQDRKEKEEYERAMNTAQNRSMDTLDDSPNIESLIRSVRTLSMPIPSRPENYNLFFQSLERAFATKKVPNETKSEILLNMLGEKASHILRNISQDDLLDYEKLKNIVLRQFQPTAQECLLNFRRMTRLPDETHTQFASRLSTSFDYYCKIREANDHKTLCDLMVSDKLFSTLDGELQSHVTISQGENWLTPQELAQKCDIFFTSKRRSLTETNYRQQKPHNWEQKFRTNRNRNQNTQFPNSSNNQYVYNTQRNTNNFKPDDEKHNVCEIATDKRFGKYFHKLHYENIRFNGTNTKSLLDSGSSILCIKTCLLPPSTIYEGSITLTGAFGEKQEAKLTTISISHPQNSNSIEIIAAACDNLCAPIIIPPNVYDCIKNITEEELSNEQKIINPLQDPLIPNINENVDQTLEKMKSEKKNKQESYAKKERNAWISPPPLLQLQCEKNILEQCQPDLEEKQTAEVKIPVFQIDADYFQEMDFSHILDDKIKNTIINMVTLYKPDKIKSTNYQMKIFLSDETPIFQRPRRLAFSEKIEVNRSIKELLAQGIISESTSDYCSPIVLCKKQDGSTRICVDYRKLNSKIIKERFPLPLLEDIFDRLEGASVYSNLDLRNGFYQVDVDPESRKYTSFVTPDNQYEFNKVPFGLCNSPSVFQKFIQIVFRELLEDGTLILYLDDLIIPSADEAEGLQKLKKVFQVAAEYGLEFNYKKCNFLQRKINFLGHILEKGTIRPSNKKTNAVLNFPQPKTAKDIQSFLGLTGYFRKFIRDYATIARPLSDLLRDNVPFHFGTDQQQAFLKLKQALSTEPVLHLYKQNSPLELHCDASSKGYGSILFQPDSDNILHPIHYMSRKTSPQEEKYSSYELEVLAIVEALKKFRHYLIGTKFKIITDCQAFQRTMSNRDLPPKIARWAMLLEDYDYQLIHRPGKQMTHVDALSRYPVTIIQVDETTQKLSDAQSKDEFTQGIKQLIENTASSNYKFKNNVLYKLVNDHELLVVPQDMQKQIVQLEHNKGHFGINKTEALVKQQFWFPHIRKTVESVISNCIPCILSSRKTGKQEGFLHPIPKGDLPLNTYHIDFLGPLPSTKKQYKYIFTVVDAFTKFLWMYPVKSTSAKDSLDKLQLQQVTFGNPDRIISDRGTAFTSSEFQKYCEDEKIEHVTVTTGQPRGNGQVEKFHGTLIPVITKLSLDDPNKWFRHVPAVQRVINSTISAATKYTPFELLTGVKMKNKEDLNIKKILEEEQAHVSVQNKQYMREEAKTNILQLQEKSRRNYNTRRKTATNYQINDKVAIKRTQFGAGLKLRPKFFGPYAVTKIRPNDRYDVRRIGNGDGPMLTSTSADMMKCWDNT